MSKKLACPTCKKTIVRTDKVKRNGVWYHHHSPVQKKNVKMTEYGLNPDKYTDEQLLRRALEKRYGESR